MFYTFLLYSKSLHSADGSFLGFLFQIERVLWWLSKGDSKGIVEVETDDDVVVKLLDGQDIKTIYEQAKNTQQKTKTPFSDKSEDFWKTLSNWVQLVLDKEIDPSISIFSAISNKKLPSDRLLIKLHRATKENQTELQNLCNELREKASSLRKGLKKYADIILECDNTIFQSIIANVTVLDCDYNHDQQFKSNIKHNLRMSEDLPFDYIYSGLFGYVSDYLIGCWKEQKPGIISVEAFLNRYTALIAEFKNKKFIEQATALLPVTNEEIEANKSRTYVEQLIAVGCQEEEILESIEHYLRAVSEKSRYAREGDVSNEMFENYYIDLQENWKNVSRPRFKACKDDVAKHQSVGYEVLYETIKYKGKINGQEPEQSYTHKGAYQFLANEIKLGWHPEWAKKFKPKQ